MTEADPMQSNPNPGEPMTEADPMQSNPNPGEPMNEANPMQSNPNPGEPMNEANPMQSNPNPGEPMTEANPMQSNPNPGEPMTEAVQMQFPSTPNQGDPMTDLSESQRELMTEDETQADTLRAVSPHDTARAILNGLACELGADELRVLARIAERLKGGQTMYGQLCLETDTRQFRAKEAREEVEDALVYLACAWLQHQEVT
jgi:hypothetical protein